MTAVEAIDKDSIETAYSFLHQKWNVYRRSTLPWQKDDIEYIISNYADDMDSSLYAAISCGNPEFLKDHQTFAADLEAAVSRLEHLTFGKQSN